MSSLLWKKMEVSLIKKKEEVEITPSVSNELLDEEKQTDQIVVE